jgi:hypothetical protein
MAVDSHFEVGQHLRDRIVLVDISDTDIFDFVEREFREIRKEETTHRHLFRSLLNQSLVSSRIV